MKFSPAQRREIGERFVRAKSTALGEALQRRQDRERTRPHILLSDDHGGVLARQDQAVRELFEGFAREYRESLMRGDLEKWRIAVHSAADLLASVSDVEFVRRSKR
jgi:hypothetical protein